MPTYVAYFRRSTAKQAITVEAQEETVRRFITGRGTLVASYTETESGKKKDRPELLKALEHCKRTRSVLVIAKLDRLARNVAFIANLMESGIEFVAVDFPEANRLTLHILAAVAELELRMISERTKTALQQLKSNGRRLGNPTNLPTPRPPPGPSVRLANGVVAASPAVLDHHLRPAPAADAERSRHPGGAPASWADGEHGRSL
jgi:prepilin-type processing-associated H-X9-DG protein